MKVYVIKNNKNLYLTKTWSGVKWVKFLYQAKLYKTETNATKAMEDLVEKSFRVFRDDLSIVRVIIEED